MRASFAVLLTAILSASTLAVENGRCSGGHDGVCVTTSSCTSSGGSYINGACPYDPANVKCCSKSPCYQGKGGCSFISDCKSPKFNYISGYCPGGSDFKCCVPTGCVVCTADEAKDFEGRKLTCCPF